ncbi:MAG TPA: dihydrofolate reductase family protein [Solirubrobacterales bacterium]|nr:dihydrofolate reductase family protein [Solirubrobacterales bacterium]
MGRIVATEFISLDGVIEDPGGSEDYAHGGWTFEFDRGDEGNKFKYDEVVEAEAQLFGRVTFEGFADSWPQREGDPAMGDFAKMINTKPKYVYSTTLESTDWQNSTILTGDFAATIRRVKDAVDGVILVAGSATLVQGLIANDLLDELRLMVFPVTLGGGKRLFADDGRKVPLTLADARTVGAGIQLLTYERTA